MAAEEAASLRVAAGASLAAAEVDMPPAVPIVEVVVSAAVAGEDILLTKGM